MLPANLLSNGANSNLYVAGLPPSTSEDTLRQLFNNFGDVASVRTFFGKTPTAPSYGFVKFRYDAQALAAIAAMNGRDFNGHTMTVRLANNDTTGPHPRNAAPPTAPAIGGTNLYVSGLPPDMDENGMKDIFRKFGNVVSVKLAREARIYKQYGFVHYTSPDEAEAAINAMNNRIIDRDYQLTVKYANSSERAWQAREQAMAPAAAVVAVAQALAAAAAAAAPAPAAPHSPGEDARPGVTLHVTGLPQGTSKEQLETFFAAFGQVSAKLLDDGMASGKAVALLRLSSRDEADRLVMEYNGKVLPGLDAPLAVRLAEGREAPPPRSAERYEPYKAYAESGGQPAAGSQPGSSAPLPREMRYPSPASSEFMVAVSETVSRVKGFRPVLAHTMDPTNLYIKGLPNNADELYLYSIFSPFGAIQSVRLLRDGAGACTGAALLKFGITEDADLAIRTISGNKLPDGVVLDVSVKTVRS
ncbi:elavl2 [Symbiodinium natans]|uniref:Elavl2 protein n=1 Tax=Symbiodinium natans TaxID=878477 RepID=A0A812GVJ7_9DINO|nr:elavl2 [Symbiodinium natans]